MRKRETKNQPDALIVWIVLVLLVFGFIMLTSASVVFAQDKFGDSYYFAKTQLIQGIIPGLVFMYALSRIPYQTYKKYAFPFFLFSIVLLILVLIPQFSITHSGATRWIDLKFFSFQPSEIAKLAFIIYLSHWLALRGNHMQNMHVSLIPFVIFLSLISLLILLQPDLGTLIVIVTSSVLLYFIAGGRITHLVSLGLVGSALFTLLILKAPYRLNRILAFLDPSADPQGIGYQINQALLAVGSGGWFGLGLGRSRQKYHYLPEVTGDSIFAIIAEELGFFFSIALVLLFLLLCQRAFRAGRDAPDNFGKYLAIGIALLITLQALLNISAIIAVVPLTGLPLPFISNGSTSLITTLAGIGILLNISSQAIKGRQKFFRIFGAP